MTVTLKSGFEALVTGVTAYFATLATGVHVATGYRERMKQINQGTGGANRVVFLPGDPNGAGGRISPPKDVGHWDVVDYTNPQAPVLGATIRPLASWDRQFTMSVWGYDASKPRDELAQLVATEALLEHTVRAIEGLKGTGGVNVAWGTTTWTVPKENTLGAEVLVGLALSHPLMDAPDELGSVGFTLERT